MAFKIVEDPFGQFTFMRVYQGTIEKGEMYFNQRTGRKERFSRIVRMHADKREEIDAAEAGDIVAIMGIDCASGDTYASASIPTARWRACSCPSRSSRWRSTRRRATAPTSWPRPCTASARKTRRSTSRTDEETSETIIAGMGELHLEIYVERIRREYKVEVEVGAPKVSYREAPTQAAEFNYKHKKQTGGSGQYAHIVGTVEPLPRRRRRSFVFEDKVVGGRIPKKYIPSVEKGFRSMLEEGTGRRLSGRRREGHARRRFVSRRRQLRHGVPDLRADLMREKFGTKPVLSSR